MSKISVFELAACLRDLPGTAKFFVGFLLFTFLGLGQSRSAEGQFAGCPCGCGGVGGCTSGGSISPVTQTDQIDSRINSRWQSTASSFATGPRGNAVNLTWGIAAEGSNIPGTDSSNPGDAGSNLVDFLDGIRDTGSTGGADLTQRGWFDLFEQSTDRISQLSGVTFDFESNDDGLPLFVRTPFGFVDGSDGQLGARADIRIGGRSVDGQSGSNTLAFARGANSGEVVFDTDNVGAFSSTFNDSVAFRNILTHELFHALGISHVESSGDSFLLNPNISLAFDGPQLDDILTLQRNYGDFLEATNNLQGNDTVANATDLGTLSIGGLLLAGQEVDDAAIAGDEVGFISIDDAADLDVFEFSLSAFSDVQIDLTPEGATYLQGQEGGTLSSLNSEALNDLGLRLLDAGGNEIASADLFGIGEGESIFQTLDAGDYFVEVSGSLNEIQLFTLDISSSLTAVPEPNSAFVFAGMIGLLQLRRRRA